MIETKYLVNGQEIQPNTLTHFYNPANGDISTVTINVNDTQYQNIRITGMKNTLAAMTLAAMTLGINDVKALATPPNIANIKTNKPWYRKNLKQKY